MGYIRLINICVLQIFCATVLVQLSENLKSIHTSIHALRYSARTDFRSVHSRMNSIVLLDNVGCGVGYWNQIIK